VAAEIRVSVAYAERDRQSVVELAVPPGTTAAEALLRSGLRALYLDMPVAATLGMALQACAAQRQWCRG
jgi:putative ubiquitin-RnfH superfamily antitoxin RatB of RatAB toxin-antitoxin module